MVDEADIGNGLTDKSSLYITVIEAKDLISESLISECNPSVSLSFQEETQETKIKKNTSNPTWYEAFKFKINILSGSLKIEVYDNTLLGKKKIGFLSIDLSNLLDQNKRIQWYDLYNKNHNNCGQIYLKIQCITNFRQYYKTEIEAAEKEMTIIQNVFNLTNYYVENMKNPFGVLFMENLENLVNNQLFKQVDALINILEKKKESIYQKRDSNLERNSALKETNKKRKVTWNLLTKVLMYCLIIFSIISLLERSDYINLMISFLILNYFIIDKTGQIIKFLRHFILLLGSAIALDLIWFITKFGSFFVGEKNDPESKIKRIIYLIGICSTVIKVFFVYALMSLRKRKLNNDADNNEMN